VSTPFVPRIGGILSADIAVPEHAREMRFFSRVLGTGATPFWREDLTNHQGMPVVGLGVRGEEHAGLPLQWMPHIQVADVAASAARARALGGSELMHGRNDDGQSQWAVIADPNGAAFGLIPVVPAAAIPSHPSDASTPVGCIAWVDLTVSNASATRDFYQQVVGWSVQDVAMDDAGARYADYNMIGGDGDPGAGICHARGANAGLPSCWMVYLPVGDLSESLRRVSDEGGRIIKATRGSNGSYLFAAVQDPVGACLSLVAG
jgi:predicted enzyme related to lactoylglutathione lyase